MARRMVLSHRGRRRVMALAARGLHATCMMQKTENANQPFNVSEESNRELGCFVLFFFFSTNRLLMVSAPLGIVSGIGASGPRLQALESIMLKFVKKKKKKKKKLDTHL
jgi:hypothetical protein